MSQPAPNPPAADGVRPHRPTDDTEQVYFEGSPLLRGEFSRVAAFSLVAVLLVALVVADLIYKKVGFPWWLSAAAIAAAVVLVLIPIVTRKSLSYRISNYRIDLTRGLLSRTVDTMELWHVEDLRLRQSVFDRLLGVGTITIISHDDTTPTLVLKGLPQPQVLFRELEQRVIAVKRQAGVMKVDPGT